jgi:Asp-tRNA(Asn)/Glu-tRNA(Gln) amidotransferase A subunit family amidase
VIPVGLGTQVIGSTLRPASFCGCYGFKPTVGALNRGGSYDGLSQSATGMIAASLPEAWQVAYEIVKRAGGDPGFPGLYGPATPPAAARPRQFALLETDGWADASPGARKALEDALGRLTQAGIAIATRYDHADIAAAETAIHDARQLSFDINAWESRWPINTYSRRDAGKLSKAMRDRLVQAEAMTIEDYRRLLTERQKRRDVYAALAPEFDACITLAATGAAPVGPASTGKWSRPRCSAFLPSRSRCSPTAACRSGSSSWDLPIATPRCFPPRVACWQRLNKALPMCFAQRRAPRIKMAGTSPAMAFAGSGTRSGY